jgi:hypothetical protein
MPRFQKELGGLGMETNTPENHKEFFIKLKALLLEYQVAELHSSGMFSYVKFFNDRSDNAQAYYKLGYDGPSCLDRWTLEHNDASYSVVRVVETRGKLLD